MDKLKQNQLIYVYPSLSSFVKNDISFLSKKFNIITNTYNWKNKFLVPLNLISQFVFFLFHLKNSTIVVISFGGYWSLIPSILAKIFNKPCYIILNGTDCVSFPNYNYGSLRKPFLRFFIKYSFKFATKLLPVSEYLIRSDYTYDTSCKYPKQGFRYFFPNIKTPYEVIYNGFDIEFWDCINNSNKSNSFITVASVNSQTTFKLKGLDKIIEMAILLPDCEFTIVGISKEMQNSIKNSPENVIYFNFLDAEELKKMYCKNSFYLQLSISEGFGCALSEAMLCGCIPIGSNVGIISDIIGDSGFVVEKNENPVILNTFIKAINLTLEERKNKSYIAKNRIINKFSNELREQKLLKELENSDLNNNN